MDLNTISTNAPWGNSAANLNENFSRTNVEIEKLRNASFRNKGYFSTDTELKAAYPSPLKGDSAWAGSPYPGTVWECRVAGTWVNTGVVPATPTVDLSLYAKKTDLVQIASDAPVYNVSAANNNYAYTAATARAAVPTAMRKRGLLIQYATTASVWIQEQYIGSSATSGWTTETNWKPVSAAGEMYNVTTGVPLAAGTYYDSITARAAVPVSIRKQGLKITYRVDALTWAEEQYIHTAVDTASFNNERYWRSDISKDLEMQYEHIRTDYTNQRITSSGTLQLYNQYVLTGFITVVAGDMFLVISYLEASLYAATFYDSAFTKLDQAGPGTLKQAKFLITVPAGAAYVRFQSMIERKEGNGANGYAYFLFAKKVNRVPFDVHFDREMKQIERKLLSIGNKNLVMSEKYNYTISKNTGNLGALAGYTASRKIKVSPGQKYRLITSYASEDYSALLCGYDSSGAYIAGSDLLSGAIPKASRFSFLGTFFMADMEYVIPAGMEWVRVSGLMPGRIMKDIFSLDNITLGSEFPGLFFGLDVDNRQLVNNEVNGYSILLKTTYHSNLGVTASNDGNDMTTPIPVRPGERYRFTGAAYRGATHLVPTGFKSDWVFGTRADEFYYLVSTASADLPSGYSMQSWEFDIPEGVSQIVCYRCNKLSSDFKLERISSPAVKSEPAAFEMLTQFKRYLKNAYPSVTIRYSSGGYIDCVTGEIIESVTHVHSDFVKVRPLEPVLVTCKLDGHGSAVTGDDTPRVGIAGYRTEDHATFVQPVFCNMYAMNAPGIYTYTDYLIYIPTGVNFIKMSSILETATVIGLRRLQVTSDGGGSVVTRGAINKNIGQIQATGTTTFRVYNPYKEKGSIRLKGEMHCHTNKSDGKATPEQLAALYAEAGYDFWTITDHNIITPEPSNNSLIWLGNAYESTGQDTVSGEKSQHIVIINAADVFAAVGWYELTATMQEVLDHHTKEENSICILAHPLWGGMIQPDEKMSRYFDGLGFVEIQCAGTNSDRSVDLLLTAGNRAFLTSVTDWHGNDPLDGVFGINYVKTFSKSDDLAGVMSALLSGAFIACYRGGEISDIDFDESTNEITIDAGDPAAATTFIGKNGTVLKTQTGSVTKYMINGSEGYVRAKIVNGTAVCYTQPFFILSGKLSDFQKTII